MKALLLVLSTFALVLIAWALWQHFYPPFTDAQLAAAGFVDAWEPHAIVTTLLLLMLSISALGIAAFLAFGGAALRRRGALALVAVIAAGGSQLASHIELTRQVTRITGQTFGGFYGLF